jgi:hypothetical protein
MQTLVASRIAVCSWIFWPWFAAAVFWSCFGACVQAPPHDDGPQARVIASWDPLACDEPHRVVVELEDDSGASLRASAPCAIGGLQLAVPHVGAWSGRVYGWQVGGPARAIAPVELMIDDAIVRWTIAPVP